MGKKSQNNKDNKNKFNPIKNIGGNVIIWILIIGMSITALQIFSSDNNSQVASLSEFKEYLNSGRIESGTVTGTPLDGWVFEGKLASSDRSRTSEGSQGLFFKTNLINVSEDMHKKFENLNIKVERPTPGFFQYLMNFSPWLLIIFFWFFIMKRILTKTNIPRIT